MKKITLLAAFLFLCVAFSQSQIKFRYGAKGGLSFTNVTATKGSGTFDNYNSFRIGAYTEVSKFGVQNLFLRGSVFYAQRGTKYLSKEYTNKYVEVPIQVGYKYPLASFLGIYAVAGPSVSFRTYGVSGISNVSSTGKWETQKVSAGLEGGVGLELFKNIQLEASYEYGLTGDYKSSISTAKNTSLQLSLGFIF